MLNTGFDLSKVKPLTLNDSVAIWYTHMDNHSHHTFLDSVSPDEKNRALKIRNTVRSGYSIISRGILRTVLSRYLLVTPPDIRFEYLHTGKPVLASSMGSMLSFNVSHSIDVLVIAISEKNTVGIDIERTDRCIDHRQTAAVVFSPEEKVLLEKSRNSVHDFYQIWTAKEAVLKATSDGFSYPSNKFSVISSERSYMARRIQGDVTHHRRCDIHRFSLFGDFTGALAEIYS